MYGESTTTTGEKIGTSLHIVTVDPVTLEDRISDIYNLIKLDPVHLLEIEVSIGHKIRCTPDHPFLVVPSGEDTLERGLRWVKAGDIKVNDMLVMDGKDSTIKGENIIFANGFYNVKTKLFYILDPKILETSNKHLDYVTRTTPTTIEPVYDFTTYDSNHSFIANGFVTHNCLAETPEGKRAGLAKNMAMMAFITMGTSMVPVRKIIESIIGDEYKIQFPDSLLWTRVFVNGTPVGAVKNLKEFIRTVRKMRRNADLHAEVSVAHYVECNEIHISTEPGRMCRPLFVVEDGELTFNVDLANKLVLGEMRWSDLLATGTVELLDKAEEEEANIVGFPSDLENLSSDDRLRITHCEMHPSLIYGIGGSIIAFPNYNQSPRNTYQSSMGKQAIGIPFTNYREMMSGTFHTLGYVQKPLALSRAASIIGFDEMPAGQNAIIAILCRVFNEEDSLEMNQDSIDRGFMCSDKWTCYNAELRSKDEVFGIPSAEECENFKGDPSKLSLEGFPKPGTKVYEGDIIIGKYVTLTSTDSMAGVKRKKYINKSIRYDQMWPAVIDRIQIGTTGDGYTYIRVMTVQQRKPIVGDKFCYTPDHDVLTTDGWVNITKLTYDHLLASLNPKTGKVEYQSPTEIVSFEHKDDIVEVDGIGIKVTLNHKMYVKLEGDDEYKLIEVQDIIKPDNNKKVTYASLDGEIDIPVWKHRIRYYEGKVYCCTVPNHIIYVKCAGAAETPVWCGQSARHGQKGTIGKLHRGIDLPFNSQGINPDILVNSLAFPSRMTIAMLIEQWTGKVVSSTSPLHAVCIEDFTGTKGDFDKVDNEEEIEWYEDADGNEVDITYSGDPSSEFRDMYAHPKHRHLVDATPFRKHSRTVIENEMSKYGLQLGDEQLTDGITGKYLRCLTFFGPVFYQKLKHMVVDKIHARAKGPRSALSRQPMEGRSLGGGLRTGTMERDCLLAQGAARLVRDRLMEQSDEFRMWVCDMCGLPAHVEQQGKIRECRVCGTTKVSRIRIPYGTKLINQELMAENIIPRVLTTPFKL